ncbi:hypothetical protein GCM10011504_00060 [Siccirubricoccus deserti]|nr:hypothetical protein GCM10011504_00060 [Siccirubricoccus deserti]
MVLTAEQVAAAVASGCVFEPASPAAVQRLAMQRKVFYIDGQAVLAGRGDGLFETVGTLMQLIDQGRQVLAYHEAPVAASPAEAQQSEPLARPEAVATEGAPPGDATADDAPATPQEILAEAPVAAPPAQAQPLEPPARPEPVATEDAPPGDATADDAPAAPQETLAEAPVAAPPRRARRRTLPAPASGLPSVDEPTEAAPLAPDAPAVQARLPARRPGRAKPRWVTAGAERRGRRDNHWSGRQK